MNHFFIKDIEELQHYKNIWDDILLKNNNNIPFLEIDWMNLWWKFFGSKHELFIIVLTKNQHIIGFCPFMITKKKFYKEINFIGYGEASYMDFVIYPEYIEQSMVYLIKILRNLKSNYIMNLRDIFEDSKNYQYLMNTIKNNKIPYIKSNMECFYIKLENNNFDTYYNSIFSSSSRRNMRSKANKLIKLGTIEYKKINNNNLNDIFNIHEKRWQKKIGNSNFSKEKKDFYRELVINQDLPFTTDVSGLYINNQLICFTYGFIYNKRFIFKRIAHDDDFNNFSPGQIIIKDKIKESFNNDINIFDFGKGSQQYKKAWCHALINIMNLSFYTRNIYLRFIFFIKYCKYNIIKKIKDFLKKNKKIVYFKQHTLGNIKYYLSIKNIIFIIKKKMKVINNIDSLKSTLFSIFKNLLNLIYSKGHIEIMEKNLQKQSIEDIKTFINLQELTFNDINLLQKLTNYHLSFLIEKFYRGNKCFAVKYNNKIVQLIWVDYLNVNIPELNYKIKINKDSIYISFIDLINKKNSEIYAHALYDTFNLLNQRGYKRCFFIMSKKYKSIINDKSLKIKYVICWSKKIRVLKCFHKTYS